MFKVPQIGMTGLYKLLEPFGSLLLPNVAYRCVAVRKIDDIVAAGDDPQALFYTPHSLTDTKYQEDVAAGVCIVSLLSGSGAWVYVPTSFIESMPDQGGIPYTTVALAVSLSAIPDFVDLSYVKTKIQDAVLDAIGVESSVQEVVVSPVTHLSSTEHDAIESARRAKISSNPTDYAQFLEMQRQRDEALQKVSELEAYISNQLTATP